MVDNVLRQLKTCNRKAVLIPDINKYSDDIKPGTGGKETFQNSKRSKVEDISPGATPVFWERTSLAAAPDARGWDWRR